MKRITISVFVVLLASCMTFGQQYSFGIKPSFIILEAKYIENPTLTALKLSSRSSYAVGLTVQRQLSKLLGVQIEPRFIEKGYNITWGPGDYAIYKNSYISLPTLLKICPIHNFNIELGPEFSFLVDSKRRNIRESFQDNNSDDQNLFELSFITGISYSFLKRSDLGIRYGFGLTPYENGKLLPVDGPTYVNVTYKIYNRYFEFYLNTRIINNLKK
jgi:hypothetical protein